MESPRQSGRARRIKALIVALVVIGVASAIRDAGIQSDRDSYASAVAQYEQSVRAADEGLTGYESEAQLFYDLGKISKKQAEVKTTANMLIELYPVNLYSRAEVNKYNNGVQTYQSQMAGLNTIIGNANEQHAEMSPVSASRLDARPSSDRKLFELIGLAQPPKIAPSSQIEEINQGIAARYEKQVAIRDAWNKQALLINKTQDELNSLRRTLLDRYGTTIGGTAVDEGDKLDL